MNLHTLRLVLIAAATVAVLWGLVVLSRRVKLADASTAMLIMLFHMFSPIPPPRQTIEEARDAEGKKSSEDCAGGPPSQR